MGKAGRFACVLTPMTLTIASLVCLVFVGLGGTNKSSSTLSGLYFFRANTSDVTLNSTTLSEITSLTDTLTGDNISTFAGTTALGLQDFYTVSLWNYCDGASNGTITYCSPRVTKFWFNPVEIWGLNNTNIEDLFSSELKSGLKAYEDVVKWMFVVYIIAIIATAVEILVGFFALFSRWGSFATTIVSSVSSVAVSVFALVSTIVYAVLAGTFNSALKSYNIHGSLGKSMYVVVWLAVAFEGAAGLFWLLSSCCCSGRSERIKDYGNGGYKNSGYGIGRGVPVQNSPYTYDRVDDAPLFGGQKMGLQSQGVPMVDMGPRNTAYEPFRHENV